MNNPSDMKDVSIQHDIVMWIFEDGNIEILSAKLKGSYLEVVDEIELSVNLHLPVALRNRLTQLKESYTNGIQDQETRNPSPL
jgi:hypothetical protein